LCYAAAQATREMIGIAYQQEMAMTNVSIEEGSYWIPGSWM
jgi:hypothetical protein